MDQKNWFSAPPFFWRSSNFGQKNRFNFDEELSFLFFGDHLNLDRKIASILVNTYFFCCGDYLNLGAKTDSI